MTVDFPGVAVVAGEARRMTGIMGDMLRMFDGAVYIHISPAVAAQWLPLITEIAEGNTSK